MPGNNFSYFQQYLEDDHYIEEDDPPYIPDNEDYEEEEEDDDDEEESEDPSDADGDEDDSDYAPMEEEPVAAPPPSQQTLISEQFIGRGEEEGEGSSSIQILENMLESAEAEKGDCVAGPSTHRAENDTAILDYEADCPICYEGWTEEGAHQSCSLSCGHTFGRSCIERWIRDCKRKICPKCKKSCKLADIRPIYPKRIAVIDKAIQKEVESLRDENKSLKLQIQAKNSVIDQNQRDLEEFRRQTELIDREIHKKQIAACTEYQTSGLGETKRRLFEFIDEKIEYTFGSQNSDRGESQSCNFLLKQEFMVDGARVFDMSASSQIMLLCRRLAGIGRGCVLTKISLLVPNENENIPLSPNYKAVRDLCFCRFPDKLALLASMGNKLSIVSWESNNIVLSYDLPAPAWSCAWDFNSPHHVYAGLQNGMLMMFDLRQTATPMGSVNGLTSHPVHTLHSLVNNGDHRNNVRTLLSASAVGACQWNVSSDIDSGPSVIPIMENQGVCISLAYCGYTDNVVATFRPKIQSSADPLMSQPSTMPSPSRRSTILGSHVLLKKVGGTLYRNHEPIPSFVSEVRMPKSAIIGTYDSKTLFAYGDEVTRGVRVRELPSLELVKDLRPHEHPILDVKYASTGPTGLLGCISENKVQVFSTPC